MILVLLFNKLIKMIIKLKYQIFGFLKEFHGRYLVKMFVTKLISEEKLRKVMNHPQIMTL
jgi:hypothetical protein